MTAFITIMALSGIVLWTGVIAIIVLIYMESK